MKDALDPCTQKDASPRRSKIFRVGRVVFIGLLLLCCNGCGSFLARRLVQAPNSYPDWFAPEAPVTLGFSAGFLTNFPAQFVQAGPPDARIRYRIVPPADYHMTATSSNWLDHGKPRFNFDFKATLPAPTNAYTASPRGTVILLHGYALAQFSMAPWAIRLADNGWRCVLVDLRGHGKSTGKKVYYGLEETNDLSRLLDQLQESNHVSGPVEVMGESYGGALALRWAGMEPRVDKVIAIAPYVVLSNAIMNIRREYVGWMPPALLRLGIKKLPQILDCKTEDLDTTTALKRHPVKALFIAGSADTIMPPSELKDLESLSLPGSQLVIVDKGTHEALTYFFEAMDPPVLKWLKEGRL